MMAEGMSRDTGTTIQGLDHVRQSIRDVLTTPIGSRVARRDYGSRLMDLVDSPLTPEVRMEIYAATVEALDRWEPRVRVAQVGLDEVDMQSGRFHLSLRGEYLPEGREIKLDGIVV